jgi:hypothetical protein
LKTESTVIVYYCRLCFWPIGLSVDYFDWPVAHRLVDVLPQAIFVTALLFATIYAIFRRSWLGFIGAWFFAILAPSSSILPLPTEIAAERRMYLPLVAVIVVVLATAVRLGKHVMMRLPRLSAWLAVTTVVLIAVCLATMTIRRNRDFRSPVALYTQTVAVRPFNSRAEYNLGHAYFEEYGPDAWHTTSIAYSRRALELDPDCGPAIEHLAYEFQAKSDPHEAIEFFNQRLARHPDDARFHLLLGTSYARAGDNVSAEKQFRQTLVLSPDDANAKVGLAKILLLRKDDSAAEPRLRGAISNPPRPGRNQKSQTQP